MDKRTEAILILDELYKDITSFSRDILLILRKCQHVCEIMGLNNEKQWFYKEINGYTEGSSPNYRYISGVFTWELEGGFLDEFSYELKTNHKIQELKSIKETAKLEVYSGINWIILSSNTGFNQKTSDEKVFIINNKNYRFRKVGHFQNFEFKNLIYYLEQYTFNWISKTYVNLKYSSQIQNLWERYQSIVENALNKINLSNHLSIINDAIIDDNPEKWRLAVLGSRNLLHDLA